MHFDKRKTCYCVFVEREREVIIDSTMSTISQAKTRISPKNILNCCTWILLPYMNSIIIHYYRCKLKKCNAWNFYKQFKQTPCNSTFMITQIYTRLQRHNIITKILGAKTQNKENPEKKLTKLELPTNKTIKKQINSHRFYWKTDPKNPEEETWV